jgi:hypothetical protein
MTNRCRILKLSLVVASLWAATGSPLQAAATDTVAVAVLDFRSEVEKGTDLGSAFATAFMARLSADKRLSIIRQRELLSSLDGKDVEVSVDLTIAGDAIISPITGAQVIVTGRIFTVNDQTLAMAKITGVTSGRVFGEVVQGSSSTFPGDLPSALAEKISATVIKNRQALTTSEGMEPISEDFGTYKGQRLPVYYWKDAAPRRVFGRIYPVGAPSSGVVVAVVDGSGNFVDEAVVKDGAFLGRDCVVASYLTLEKWRFRPMTKDGKATSYIVPVPVLVGLQFGSEGEGYVPGQPLVDPFSIGEGMPARGAPAKSH